MASITDEIKNSFKNGGLLTQLIYINIGVFIVANLLNISLIFGIGRLGDTLVYYLSVPPMLSDLIQRPWTIFTYMFLQQQFLHILFNMLILFWFGSIFLRYLSPKQMLSTYILGGLSGAALFIIVYNISPAFYNMLPNSILLGASASVMAIVVAIAVYVPDYQINLMFIGPVRLKYLALFYVVMDFIQIASDNPGGHLAHIGGAVFGYFYIIQLRKGKDISTKFNRLADNLTGLFKPTPRIKVSYKNPSKAKSMNDMDYNKAKAETQEEIDRILDKIAKAGYDSLSKREREILFRMKGK